MEEVRTSVPPGASPSRRSSGRFGALAARDPGWRTTTRAVRSSLVVTAAAGVAWLISRNPQFDLFAIFGAIALCMFVDFPGVLATRVRSYLVLAVGGAGLVALGTICSHYPFAAPVAMAVVGFTILFCGVLSAQIGAATVAALLAFVLSVTVLGTAADVPSRLAGWGLAAVFAVPACLFLWPEPYRAEMRMAVARAARALSVLVACHANGEADGTAREGADGAVADLRRHLQSATHPATGASAQDAAVDTLAMRLEWVSTNALHGSGRAAALGLVETQELEGAVATVLARTAEVVCDGAGRPESDLAAAERLAGAVEAMAVHQERTLARAIQWLGDESPDTALGTPDELGSGELLDLLDPAFRSRALSYATGLVAEAAFRSAGVVWSGSGPAEPWVPLTAETTSAPPTVRRERAVERVAHNWLAVRRALWTRASMASVRLRNSVRGAIALLLAVIVVEITSVDHGFWVILGTLSVLRSNAMDTSTTAARAVAGTLVGFVVGTLVMVVIGAHFAALWVVLPLAVFVAGAAPTFVSFAGGQAGFTVLVIVVFNLLQPTGWRVGLTRLEDVAIGCAVSVVVGFLFWPRGATAALGRALCNAYISVADYFVTAVDRCTRSDPDPSALDLADERATAEGQLLDDAFRQYMGERGNKPVSADAVSRLYTGVFRTKLAGRSLASLPPPPDSGVLADPLERARSEVNVASESVRTWYLAAAGTLAVKGQDAPPPLTPTRGLRTDLLAAFEDARVHHPDQLRMAIRLLWVDESLAEQATFQATLGVAVDRFSHRRRAPAV